MNPFRAAPGSDPPILAGRDSEAIEAQRAIDLTAAGGAARPIVLTGLRGMGKTALLRRFERSARTARGIVIAAEATTRGSLTTTLRAGLEDARRELAPISSRLRESVDALIAVLPEASYEAPGNLGSVSLKLAKHRDHERLSAALESLNGGIRSHGRWLAIAIDEIQQGDPATLDSLISTIHKTAGTDEPILFLGAGLRDAKAHLKSIRTYTERWRYLELDLLSLSETMDAIGEPARANGHPFTAGALERLSIASQGYPFFVQEYASIAWSRRDVARKTITLENVEAAIPLVAAEVEGEFYRDPLARLTPRELAYATALATLGEGPQSVARVSAALGMTSTQTSSTRQQLFRKDVAYSPDRGIIEFRVPLTATYIAAHGDELRRRVGIVDVL